MGEWSAAVLGEVELGAGGVAAWHARRADPTAYRDWPKPKATPNGAGKVATLLRTIARACGNTLVLETDGARVRVRALFHSEADLFWQALALALREAAPAGGRGTLMVVDASEPPSVPPLDGVAYRLELDGTRSRLAELRGAVKRRALADPSLFAALVELLGATGRAQITPRQRAREQAAARGEARLAKAATRRRHLGSDAAASQLARRAKTPFKTSDASRIAAELVAKLVAEPSEKGELALASAWRELVSRAPRPKHLPEYEVRLRVGKALCRLSLPGVADKALRARAQAIVRKEWPDEKQLREVVNALAKHRGWPS